MNIQFVSATQSNTATLDGDEALIANGKSTWQENVVEFAGRLCYASHAKMGTSPHFISARVREGHEDIIEHIVVTVKIDTDEYGIWTADDSLNWLRAINRHCEITDLHFGKWIVSGNLRVWLAFFRDGVLTDALPILTAIAPGVFAEFGIVPAELPGWGRSPINVPQTTDGPQRVTLLGANRPNVDDLTLIPHGSATFLFEGISRACTHQLVRHRLASFSQESQRYVDLSKGEWSAIIPPVIADNPEALAIMSGFWELSEGAYSRLRALGIRKEDARFLLPNAAETRIVVTMNFEAWQHFLWLRAVDKAAQWEIRAMGQQVLAQLYQIAPVVFQDMRAAI